MLRTATLLLSSAALGVTLSSSAELGHPGSSWRPGPAGQGAPVRWVGGMGKVDSASCEKCHAEIAQEWASSGHRSAFTERIFQDAFAAEPKPFCQGCHAPESSAARQPSSEQAEEGVGCASCHVTPHGTIAGVAGTQTEAHATDAAPWMAQSEACASCHQFDFPAYSNQPVAIPMQSTLTEWQSSRFAAESCQSCHMPDVQGDDGRVHKSHRFDVRGDPEILRRAVQVSASWEDADTVRLELASGAVGHAVPTGDLFRRLELRAEAIQPTGYVEARARPIQLGRTFADHGRARVQTSDDRLMAPGTTGDRMVKLLRMPAHSRAAVVTWRVVYQRVGTSLGGQSDVMQEIVIHEGPLP